MKKDTTLFLWETLLFLLHNQIDFEGRRETYNVYRSEIDWGVEFLPYSYKFCHHCGFFHAQSILISPSDCPALPLPNLL